jgi:hypothetical protein
VTDFDRTESPGAREPTPTLVKRRVPRVKGVSRSLGVRFRRICEDFGEWGADSIGNSPPSVRDSSPDRWTNALLLLTLHPFLVHNRAGFV